jgi:hypothetical protein
MILPQPPVPDDGRCALRDAVLTHPEIKPRSDLRLGQSLAR